VVVLTVIDEELSAALEEFGASHEISGSGCWAREATDDSVFPVIVTQCLDRSNLPAMESVRDLIEDWQPEYVLLVGIAGGIARSADGESLSGPAPGDVVLIEYVHYGEYVKRVDGRRLLRYYAVTHPSADLLHRHAKPLARTEWFVDLPLARPSRDHGDEPALTAGEIVAVEFLAGDATVSEQREVFGQYDHALAVDMESAGVARAMDRASNSVHYHPRWLGIRGVSDRTAADERAESLLVDNDAERSAWRDYAACAAARVARLTVQRLLLDPRPPQAEDLGAPSWGTEH
jgi:nucleoside phosphorylase